MVQSVSKPLVFLAFALTLGTTACSRTTTAPDLPRSASESSSGIAPPATSVSADALPADAIDVPARLPGGRLVDLDPGRLTRVAFTFRLRIIPDGEDPGPWEEHHLVRQFQVMGTTERNGLTYAVETFAEVTDEGVEFYEPSWFRQDGSGLFLYQEDLERGAEARDRSGVGPPGHAAFDGSIESAIRSQARDEREAEAYAAAWREVRSKLDALASLRRSGDAELAVRAARRPGGVGPAEITFLRYPLRPGASWEGRVGFNVWTVEALESLPSPVGRIATARLRIELPEFFGPQDRALTWWGIPGEVRRAYHFESIATDETGEKIGTFEAEESYALLDYLSGSAP